MNKVLIFSFLLLFSAVFSLHAQPVDDPVASDARAFHEDLKKRVDDLESDNRNLKTKVDDLEDRVDDLEQRLGEA